MAEIICPFDGKPCDENCPDRYRDAPEGGCIMTTAMEFADVTIILKEAAQ